MSTDLQRKKSEAATAWQEYMTAVEKAENNRQTLTGARAAIFQALTGRNTIQIAPAYLAMRSTEQQQSQLDSEEKRLGKRFDEISDELASLQQTTLTISQMPILTPDKQQQVINALLAIGSFETEQSIRAEGNHAIRRVLNCSADEAQKILDDLRARKLIEPDITRDGHQRAGSAGCFLPVRAVRSHDHRECAIRLRGELPALPYRHLHPDL